MKHVLESEYEKLKPKDGAFELMRAKSGGTSGPLKLILMPSDGYSIPHVRDLVGSNTLLYIRSMKSCLSLDKPPQPVIPKSVYGVQYLVEQRRFGKKKNPVHQFQSCISAN